MKKLIANKISGLSSKEVEERLKNGQNNKMVDENAATTSSIIRQNIFTYFNLIFAIISLLLLIAGSFKSLTFFYLLSSLTLSSELLNNCALKKY
mgnify:CR=1 FL=1